jgi:predicted N-acetyltransferase YhbS
VAGLIRALTPSDAAAACALVRRAFAAQSVATDPPSGALTETPETIAAALSFGGGAAFEEEEAIIGCVLWEEKGGGFYLGRLAVDPAFRRRGIARALVAAAEAAAVRRGLPLLHVRVRLALLDNRRLFATCGFVETTRHAHAGHSEPTSVAMEKRLGLLHKEG